jgi:hypothetical protein
MIKFFCQAIFYIGGLSSGNRSPHVCRKRIPLLSPPRRILYRHKEGSPERRSVMREKNALPVLLFILVFGAGAAYSMFLVKSGGDSHSFSFFGV